MNGYNVEKLSELLKHFYNLTGMKICVWDSSEHELCYYPSKLSDFCALVREDPELDARCAECDRLAVLACKRTKKQYSYTCHAGLRECVSPVLHGDVIIGYIVVGQIKSENSGHFSAFLKTVGKERREKLLAAYDSLRTFEAEKIESAVHVLDACTGYEYLKSLINTDDAPINVQIDAYISENIDRDLSVKMLCHKLHLSHGEIYNVFKSYFNSTPAEYVKSKRLALSLKLLKNTALPVSEVAKRCGISDYNYFSKSFKKAFSKSPREYRRASREK